MAVRARRPVPHAAAWFPFIVTVPAAVLVLLGAIMGFEVYAFAHSPVTAVRIAIVLVPTTIVLGGSLWALAAPRAASDRGVPVGERDQPELWALLRRLAAALGTEPPRELRLVSEAEAAVEGGARLLGLLPARRRLYIGVPLLAGLGAAELAAVLAHELAHLGGLDARLGGAVYRGRRSFAHLMRTLDRGDPIQRAVLFLLRPYGMLMLRLTAAASRRQEAAADEAAARAVGSAAVAAALREADRLARSWAWFRAVHLHAAWDAGYLPADVIGGYRRCHAALGDSEGAPSAKTDPYDTHPPTAERIALLDALAFPGTPTHPAGPALGLLREPSSLLDAAVLADLGPDASAKRRADWPTLYRIAAVAALASDTERVFAAASRITGRPPSLHTLLDAVEAGALEELGTDPDSPIGAADAPRVRRERARLAVRRALEGAVVEALADTGVLRWHESWPAPGRPEADDRLRRPLPELLDAAVDDRPDTAPLRALLESTQEPISKAGTRWHCS